MSVNLTWLDTPRGSILIDLKEAKVNCVEDFILINFTKLWQRLLVRFITDTVSLGQFKKEDHALFFKYYVFKCGKCDEIQVSYSHGQSLLCQNCKKRTDSYLKS